MYNNPKQLSAKPTGELRLLIRGNLVPLGQIRQAPGKDAVATLNNPKQLSAKPTIIT